MSRATTKPGSAMTESLVIPSRFCGPPSSGNGGYVCGRIAAYFDGAVTVTLRQPPPLATPMTVERAGESSIGIRHGRRLIAEASSSPSGPALEIPGPVSTAEAHAVIAWPGGRHGRRLLAGSALVGPGGQVLAAARTVWLTVPRPAQVAKGVS